MNVDSFMTPFLRMIYDGVSNTFHTMELISFGGTNFLQVMITIMILSVALPILISITRNTTQIDRGGKK